MTKDQEQIIAQVQLQIKPNEDVDEDKITKLVDFFRMLTGFKIITAETMLMILCVKRLRRCAN